MRSNIVRLVILLTIAAVTAGGYYLVRHLPERKVEIPMVQVKRGDLVVQTYVRGELRAVRSTLLTTPNLGGTAQVTLLAPNGALARSKDLIVEFDDSDLLASLEDAELAVTQATENITKAEADLKIRRNQDQVDLLKARYAVRRAELEVKRNDLISAIDARKNILTLEESKRALAQLEEDIKSRLQQGEAEIAVLREQQRKATLEVGRVKSRLAQTRILAPMTGLVSIKENRSGGFFFGQQLPDIREGDQLSPGMPIAEILDLSELEVSARVNEVERASLREGQEVLVRLDALPGKIVHGKIKTMGGTASSNVFSSDPTKRFDCTFSVDMRELLKDVGATPAQIEQVQATAAENAKHFQPGGAPPGLPGLGGPGPGAGGPMIMVGQRPGGAPAAAPVAPGAPSAPGPQAAGTPAGGMPDQQRMRQVIEQALGGRDPRTMTPADRQKIEAEIRQKLGAPAARTPGTLVPAGAPPAGGPGVRVMIQPPGAGGPAAAPGAIDIASLSLRQAGGQQTTAEEREKATLPPPPEENSVMDVLLRPGLLVESEIIIEKIPNAIYVPQQAVFEKAGKTVVFARARNRFEPRVVKLGKRSESQVAIVEGLREGEWISMSDMEAGRSPSKKDKAAPQRSQPAVPATRGGMH
jgi:HlyD family secretion protein